MAKDTGTPETAARLAPHPIWTLLQRKYILPEHADAAWEIESAFKSLTAPVTWRYMRFEGEGVELRPPSFVNHLTDRQARQIEAYNDWVDRLTEMGADNIYAAVLDVLTEPDTLREIERARQWKNGTAKVRIRTGLQVYCEAAGTLVKPA